jgi:hypothetical protein
MSLMKVEFPNGTWVFAVGAVPASGMWRMGAYLKPPGDTVRDVAEMDVVCPHDHPTEDEAWACADMMAADLRANCSHADGG